MIRYTLYGAVGGPGLTHDQLLAHAREHNDLLARPELSGSEGCYVEVARWHADDRLPHGGEWRRWCFEKVFGGEHPAEADLPRVCSFETAARFADEINAAAGNEHVSLIHNLPTWA